MKNISSAFIKTTRPAAAWWFIATAIALLCIAGVRAAEPNFTNVTAAVAPGLPQVGFSSVAWADFDGDGRLDFLLTGSSTITRSNADEGEYNVSFPVSELWRNTGNGFTNVTATVAPGLPASWNSSVVWGDYDNDGRPDFLVMGSFVSQIWRNTGSNFVNVTDIVAPGLTGVSEGAAAW